jgi:holo-[acyl-carrier protein] synthase
MTEKNIIGIGTDIVNITRIEDLFKKFGDRFLVKNFHELEISCWSNLQKHQQIGYLAKRFAAKEAIAKALGVGIGKTLAFSDIAIMNDSLGAPKVKIDNNKISGIEDCNIHISLSDDKPFAIAFVVISK